MYIHTYALFSLGIPQTVILTKIDKFVGDFSGNAANVFTNEEVKKVVENVSDLLGLQKNTIFPVKNYESEIDLDDDVDILALMALRQMHYLAEDYLENLLMNMRIKSAVSTDAPRLPSPAKTDKNAKSSTADYRRHRKNKKSEENPEVHDSETTDANVTASDTTS